MKSTWVFRLGDQTDSPRKFHAGRLTAEDSRRNIHRERVFYCVLRKHVLFLLKYFIVNNTQVLKESPTKRTFYLGFFKVKHKKYFYVF